MQRSRTRTTPKRVSLVRVAADAVSQGFFSVCELAQIVAQRKISKRRAKNASDRAGRKGKIAEIKIPAGSDTGRANSFGQGEAGVNCGVGDLRCNSCQRARNI